jgi:uncharacterized membrane protein
MDSEPVMTDTWSEERQDAGLPPAPEPHPAPVAGPASWPLYATPAAPAPESPPASMADPLILELEHIAPALPAGESAPSVFGHVEPLAEPTPSPEPLPVVESAPVVEPVVAQAEKPVEPAPEPADPVRVVEPPPPPAPIVAAPAPQPARSTLTETSTAHSNDPHGGLDPVLAGFDHVVALAGYVLLFISVFMFGIPALATMALAYAHKNDSHLLVRSHYRFQLRIFWTAVLFGLLAIGSAVTAGGLAVSKLVDFVRAHLPGVDAMMTRANVGSWSGEIAGLLVIAAVTLGVLAVIWTLGASLFGFLRLVANRPIGHQYAGK